MFRLVFTASGFKVDTFNCNYNIQNVSLHTNKKQILRVIHEAKRNIVTEVKGDILTVEKVPRGSCSDINHVGNLKRALRLH